MRIIKLSFLKEAKFFSILIFDKCQIFGVLRLVLTFLRIYSNIQLSLN